MPAGHPGNLRATRAEVRSSRARSCVTDFVSEVCEVSAVHQVKCSSWRPGGGPGPEGEPAWRAPRGSPGDQSAGRGGAS